MTALTVRTQDSRSSMIGISFHCQCFASLSRATFAEMREHYAQEILILQQPVRLPHTHNARFTLLRCVAAPLVHIANTGQLVNTFYGIRVDRGHSQADNALIGCNVNTSLALKDTDQPAKFKFVHAHYVLVIGDYYVHE